jgi:drug/metabolite transporter (DMT)-like permease
VLAALFLHETLNASKIAGIACAIAAVILLTR